jgi:hypothetical protein
MRALPVAIGYGGACGSQMRRLILAAVTVAALLAGVAPALAAPKAVQEPWWHLSSGARPSKLAPGSEGEIVVSAENLGDEAANIPECVKVAPGAGGYRDPRCTATGSSQSEDEYELKLAQPTQILDTLPPGLRALGIAGTQPKPGGGFDETVPLSCSLEHLSCESSTSLAPFDQLEVRIEVQVLAVAQAGEANALAVSGGGAPDVQISRPLQIGAGGSAFGVEEYGLSLEGEGGMPVTQAGSHPFQVTGTIALDQGPDTGSLTGPPQAGPVEEAKDIVARLPPGMIADPGTVPRCLLWEFLESDGLGERPECSEQTAVGVASVTAEEPGGGTYTFAAPIFNIEPEAGEPARFGFVFQQGDVPVLLDTGLRSGPGEDWGVDLSTNDLPQNVGLTSVRVTFWGVPDRDVHENSRGWGCLDAARGQREAAYEPCAHYTEELHPSALLTMPTSCTGPLQSSVQADPWAAPGDLATFPSSEALPALSGCGELQFSPGISTEPTTHAAASPSGLAFDLTFDSEGLLSADGLAQSDLQRTVVNLPEGMTIDPSAGVGLGACTEAQFAQATLNSPAGAGCPENSKLGTVEIETPLLFTTVYGSMYVAQPYENPFSEPGHPNGSLIAIYVIARSRAERGILVKLSGKVSPNPVTGQLTVTFENDPQLPFARFNFHFREGQQAPLITPATCGTYTTQAQLTPFSEPAAPLLDTSSFQITSGSEGSACPSGGAPPFAPQIQAGTLNDDAGVFSPFYVELSRSDAMQEIASYSTDLPVGLTANLTGIPFCPEADIEASRHRTGIQEENEPSCPQASLIGHTLVGTGVGSVLDYVPGKLYLAGPFHGDPFSVVSVTSAVVGPFDLGTIVIRFALAIDPYTAQVRIDPTGSEPIPTIIDGIVTHVRDIRVSIDRGDFTLNPTGCQPQPVASTLTSDHNQATTISTPFQAVKCPELAFKPTFKASTQAKTTRLGGASLSVKLTMPISLGTQANIKQVKVALPPQLPARLATLQKACTEKQFDANPAGCPAASTIGHANATTPILPVPLTGPAIFVSHGGEAFPSLILVLQGYGVTIDLVGATNISPKGVLSTTFKAVPDQPVGSFELTLPEGPYSALAAIGNLCRSTRTTTVKRTVTVRVHGHPEKIARKIARTRAAPLKMPTEFLAQNGAVDRQNTTIAVTGCSKSKRTSHGRRKSRRAHKTRRGRGIHRHSR